MHTNKVSYIEAERAKWKEAAYSGDSEAQFRFANSFCCGQSAYFSLEEATTWWCRAARQKHKGAQAALKKHQATCSDQQSAIS